MQSPESIRPISPVPPLRPDLPKKHPEKPAPAPKKLPPKPTPVKPAPYEDPGIYTDPRRKKPSGTLENTEETRHALLRTIAIRK